jgi:hypothetical protein
MRATGTKVALMSIGRYLIVLLAGLASLAASSASAARPPHPWCMVVQDVSGVWACAFDSFAQCRQEARSGNEGFCAPNPGYPSPRPAAPRAHARKAPR